MEDNNPNQIVKVFENHEIFIFGDRDEDNKRQYYFKAADVGKVLDIVNKYPNV